MFVCNEENNEQENEEEIAEVYNNLQNKNAFKVFNSKKIKYY